MLTKREALAAAESARRWHRGHAQEFIFGSGLDAKECVEWIFQAAVPQRLIKKGCPSVAVAACRGEISFRAIAEAFADIHNAVMDMAGESFMDLLQREPSSLVPIFKKIAYLP